MAVGLGRLRMAPAVFWAMTLPELAAAIRGVAGRAAGAGPISRPGLAALMQRYPDKPAAVD